MTEPFKPITREEAAEVLSVSLSTLDNMIGTGALPAPVSIHGSRRKYWHPAIFYGWLDKELRRDPSMHDAPFDTRAHDQSHEPPGRRSQPIMGIADRARARNAARISQINTEDA